jgi:outer membrane lipoprotein-sorting protein
VATNLFAITADEMLLKSDQFRNRMEEFSIKTRITNFKNGIQTDQSLLEVMIKGDDKSLIKFLDKKDSGRFVLMREDNMWIYIPNTRKPIRISPLQRLMGEASNGDVARTNLNRDYRADLIREEIITLENKNKNVQCYLLELKAEKPSATYSKIELWIKKDNYQPVKSELYLASGKHYKTLIYEEYSDFDGSPTLTKLRLIDRLKNNSETTMEYLKYKKMLLPDKYFNRNYMKNLK